MTTEQMIEIAQQHFDYQWGWIANTEDLLKFAQAMYDKGYNQSYDDSKNESFKGFHNSLDDF